MFFSKYVFSLPDIQLVLSKEEKLFYTLLESLYGFSSCHFDALVWSPFLSFSWLSQFGFFDKIEQDIPSSLKHVLH